MTENNNALIVNIDSNGIIYIEKFSQLLKYPSAYEDGNKILETIKNQLDSLKIVKKDTTDTNYDSVPFSFSTGGLRV